MMNCNSIPSSWNNGLTLSEGMQGRVGQDAVCGQRNDQFEILSHELS